MATKVQKFYDSSASTIKTFQHFPAKSQFFIKYNPRTGLTTNPTYQKYYRTKYFSSSRVYKRRMPSMRRRSSSKMYSSRSSSSASSSSSVSPPPSSARTSMSSVTPPYSMDTLSTPPTSPSSSSSSRTDSPTPPQQKRKILQPVISTASGVECHPSWPPRSGKSLKRKRPESYDDVVYPNKKLKLMIEEALPTTSNSASSTSNIGSSASVESLKDQAFFNRRSNVRRILKAIKKDPKLAEKLAEKIRKGTKTTAAPQKSVHNPSVPESTEKMRSHTKMNAAAQKGMQNPNILCYRNSVLQALLHVPKFVEFLAMHPPRNCSNREKCLTCSLRGVATSYWDLTVSEQEFQPALRSLDKVFKNLGWSGSCENRNQQMDADELLSWLLTTMTEELKDKPRNDLEAVTQLCLNSRIPCTNCKNVSKTEMKERSLSVPLQPRIPGGSLSSYVEKYMHETIDDYTCEKCKKKGGVDRSQAIASAPDMLVVQLKRFDWRGKKNKLYLPIEQTLDLSSYRDPSNEDGLEYELMSFVSHMGTLNGGHYISNAVGPDGRWKCFNDRRMTPTSVNVALESKDFQPYLLFYQRKQEI